MMLPKKIAAHWKMLLTAAGAAVLALAFSNAIVAVDAHDATVQHHQQIRNERATAHRRMHRIKTDDAMTLSTTIDKLQTRERVALVAQKKKDTAAAKKAIRKAKDAAYKAGQDAGYDSGYSSGTSAGYNSGYSSGQSTGQSQGFAQGYATGSLNAPVIRCSNDPNVTWLPYCY